MNGKSDAGTFGFIVPSFGSIGYARAKFRRLRQDNFAGANLFSSGFDAEEASPNPAGAKRTQVANRNVIVPKT